ncbi:unnamed protein product [Discosporangium mesarthrocarpum]
MQDSSTVVIPPDFRLPASFAGLGIACALGNNLNAAVPLVVVGGLLAVQATRVKFEFDAEAMEVKLGSEDGELVESGDNRFVGGKNRWRYNTWTNWECFPSEKLPVLMYFKETQTKPEGQIHFFPFIMSPGILLEQIRARVPIDK